MKMWMMKTWVVRCTVTAQASINVCVITAIEDAIVSGFSISNTCSGFFKIVTQNLQGKLMTEYLKIRSKDQKDTC